MPLILPEELDPVISPVFAALPLARAMSSLLPTDPAPPEVVSLVQSVVDHPALAPHLGVQAGLWLYVDELDKSHDCSQALPGPTGCYWHAIMHRREGDFNNAKYWYRKAGAHPAMNHIDLAGGTAAGSDMAEYDAIEFVDRVARADARHEPDSPDLVALQHHEWKALFEWCTEN
ncbi:MAG: hypothetical protein ACIAXF_05205 [Phycisphaerales bacterium JB063]